MDMDSTLSDRPNATFNNLQSVVLALWYGEMAAADADMIASSQLLGWPGDLYQPFMGPLGNCPDLSLLDWRNGEGNARFHTEKMMIDSLGSGMKNVLPTSVNSSSVYARAFTPAQAEAHWKWRWPSHGFGAAVLLANLSPDEAHTVHLPGAAGGDLLSVTFRQSGYGLTPYRREGLGGDTFELAPLATAVALLSRTPAAKADDETAHNSASQQQRCLSSGMLAACIGDNGALQSLRSGAESWRVEGWSGFDTCGWLPSAAAAGTVDVAATASSVTSHRVCGNGTIIDSWAIVPGLRGVLQWRATFVSASTEVFGPSWLASHLTFRNASNESRLWVPVGDFAPRSAEGYYAPFPRKSQGHHLCFQLSQNSERNCC